MLLLMRWSPSVAVVNLHWLTSMSVTKRSSVAHFAASSARTLDSCSAPACEQTCQ